MKIKSLYQVIWEHGQASGSLPGYHTSRKQAEAAAREWKRGMLDIETTPKDRRDARAEYHWEVITVRQEVEEPAAAKRLPPDPDEINDDRAEWAGKALAAFMDCTRTWEEDAVADLIADLMHWCDRNGQDFARELARGQGMYREETLDPNESEDPPIEDPAKEGR